MLSSKCEECEERKIEELDNKIDRTNEKLDILLSRLTDKITISAETQKDKGKEP